MHKDSLREFAGKGDHLFVLKGNDTIGKGEEGIVAALLHILAGMKLGAALANDDLARVDDLTAKGFDAEALGDGIAPELGRAAGFTMCHKGKIGITGEG